MKPKSALRHFLALAGSSILAVSSTSAATLTWDSDTGTSGVQETTGTFTWAAADAKFWNGSANVATTNDTTTDIAQFGNGGTLASSPIINVSSQSINGLIFGATTTRGYTLQASSAGQALTIGGSGITINSGAQATTVGSANLGIILGAAQSWTNNASTTLTIGGAVTNGANLLTIGGSGSTTVSGIIGNGAGGLTKSGSGTLILSGANSYTGTTTINGGTLQVGTGTVGSLNGTTGTALTFGGTGTFNVREAASSTQGMGALTFSAGDATITSTAAGASSAATLTFASLNARAAGATANFTLATNTTSTGGTPNKIVFTNTTNVPLASGSNNAGIFFGGSNYARYDAAGYLRAVIYGTDSNANAALSGAQTTLGTIGTAIDARYDGSSYATANTTAVGQNGVTVLNVLDGSAFKAGQAITGTNISANTFIVSISGNALTLNQATGNVAASTVLTPYNSVSAQTTGSVNTLNLSGAGASLTLAASQTLSVNGILRSGGTAGVVGAISGGTGIQTISSGGELLIRTDLAGDVLNINSPILANGASSLTKSGAGILALSGNNTYTGVTTINTGTVLISHANALGTTAGNTTITATGSSSTGGQLQLTGGITTAENITITGSTDSSSSFGAIQGSTGNTVTLSGNVTLSNLTGGIRIATSSSGAKMNFTGNISQTGSSQALLFSLGASGGQNVTIDNPIALNGGSLIVTGNGSSLILKGVNATDGSGIGTTTINSTGAGIQLGVTNAINTTATLSVDGGAFNLANFNQTVNALNGASTGVVSNTVAGTRTLTVGNGGGSGTFSGTIITGTGNIQLIKTGAGTQTLSGANTYTGTTTVNGGTLSLTGSLSSSSALVVGGGTFSYGGAAAQTVSGLTVNAGGSVVTNTNSGVTNVLNLGAITRSAGGGSVTFSTASAANNVVTTSNANINGILGAWATVGSDWAVNDGTGKIVAYTGYTDINRLTPGTIADGSTTNVRIIEGSGAAGNIGLTAPGTTVIHTLQQSASGGAGSATVDVGTGNTLRTAGLMVASGAGALTIGTAPDSGTVTAASAGGELVALNQSANSLTVNSVIANNTSASSLTKAGTGTLTLSATNTYTGATTVTGGALIINGNISTSSLTTVQTGATLGGSGTVGALTVQANGTIAPGNSPDGIDVIGAYTQPGIYQAEITANTPGNGTTGYDQVNVTGTIDITGGSLTTLFSGTGYAANDLLFILLNDDTDAIIGTYTGLAQGAVVTTFGGFDWQISYTGDSAGTAFTGGNDVALMAVATIPEPRAALLGGFGLLMLLRRRRR